VLTSAQLKELDELVWKLHRLVNADLDRLTK
jgi:hypothetical protein